MDLKVTQRERERESMVTLFSSGVGVLYVSRRPRVRIDPIMSGGGQERGMRSGTVPHTLVVGLGAACDIAAKEMEV